MSESIFITEKKFDLAETLDCGQAFRWEEIGENKWQGIAIGRELIIEQKGNKHIFHCSEEDFNSIWKSYFDLEEDYEGIRSRLSELSPVLKEASSFAPGIRILRQEPWEAVCSFIISQNNNIPRIKGIIKRLCELCGEKVGSGYSFPKAEVIALRDAEFLAPIRSGFRAKYILDAAKRFTEDKEFAGKIEKLPLEEARKELMTIKGIGPKVSDCALLYGFHRTECFPMDVWMKRAMSTLLPEVDPSSFGKDAGIAQQYIFHYSRMHPELFE